MQLLPHVGLQNVSSTSNALPVMFTWHIFDKTKCNTNSRIKFQFTTKHPTVALLYSPLLVDQYPLEDIDFSMCPYLLPFRYQFSLAVCFR